MNVQKVTVERRRIIFVVKIAPTFMFTTPEVMERVLQDFPALPHHTCLNKKGPTFQAVMNHTSWAHLLEHLVIDLQVRSFEERGESSPRFVGNTQWIDEEQGIARVQVSFRDDLVALRAFKEAIAYLNEQEERWYG